MQRLSCETNLKRETASDLSESLRECCAPTADEVRLQLFDVSQREAMLEIWRDLQQRLGSRSLMCSAEWTETWLDHYRDSIDVLFVVGYRQEQVCGICLLSESKHHRIGPVTIRTLHLGTAGELHGESVCVEYNDILCEPRYRNEFVSELQKLILEQKNWDQFRLDGIDDAAGKDWPLLNETASLHQHQITVQSRIRESRYFDLKQCRAEGGDILSLLGKSTRSNIRRRIKKLGETELEWAETVEQANDIFAELVELHQARWKKEGQPGAFASSRFSRFQKELITRLIPQQKVVLCRMKTGSQTIGCLYLLVDCNRLLDYVSGLASFEDVPGSGLVSHYLCMNEAMQRGYDAYDFLVGEKRHKENLGKSANQLRWVVCERKRAIFRLRHLIQKAKHLVKRIVRKP